MAKTTTASIIKSIVPRISELQIDSPSEFIKYTWQMYKNNYPSNKNLNGKVFEELISITLIKQNIFPFYMQAKVAFIPNVNYDFVIYSQNKGPLVLSVKTSLRERYKQADLEAVALKYIHRKSESYVLTLDEKEAELRQTNMDGIMGINDFILATSKQLDILYSNIRKENIIESPIVKVVESSTMITRENYLLRYQ